jgi:nucleotide-binding universal stress UspA family protein
MRNSAKRILVATDGSRLASRAVRISVELAGALRRTLVGVYVIPPSIPPMYHEESSYSPQAHKRYIEKLARKALAPVEIAARAAGVRCVTVHVASKEVWRGILRVARSQKCGLIVVASRGRWGIAGQIVGSETMKLLAHAKLPVLVCQ